MDEEEWELRLAEYDRRLAEFRAALDFFRGRVASTRERCDRLRLWLAAERSEAGHPPGPPAWADRASN